MATIAEALGITGYEIGPAYWFTYHAARQAQAKGFALDAVLEAANDPTVQYPSNQEGQRRHIRGDICAVVNVKDGVIVTVYRNVEQTALRPDQRTERQ